MLPYLVSWPVLWRHFSHMWFPLCLLIVSIKGVCQCPWLFYFFFLNCHSSGYVQRNVLDLLELELQGLMSCLMYVLGIKLRSHLFGPFMFVLIQSYVSYTVLECVMYPVFYECMLPYKVYEVLESVTC